MNRREIREFVRRLLNEADASDSYWTDDQLNSYIQAAYDQIVLEGELMQCTSETNSLAGAADYQMPADVFLIQRVWYEGKPLAKTSPQELDELDPEWLTRSVDPGQLPTHWIPRGHLFRIYPIPTQSGQKIVLWGIQSPRPLQADTDRPEIQEAYHVGIAYLAAYLAASADYTNDLLQRAAERFATIYRGHVQKAWMFTLRKERSGWRLKDIREKSPRLWQALQ